MWVGRGKGESQVVLRPVRVYVCVHVHVEVGGMAVESCGHLEVEAAAVNTWRLSSGRGRCQNRSHGVVMGEGWCGAT